jgi:outer membrane protein OmpA-like peptidoglycan-associated protein
VVDYLVLKGITPIRLSSKGFGSTKPVAENTTEIGRAKNRRTELMVVEN